ncbi:MAG: type II toxin-antitoxin system VapC family toxin [Armatimonadota bacterium]|jgi:ribonuclease VapC
MNHEAPRYVLDAFAAMCLLNREPGSTRIVEVLARARDGDCTVSLCTVNWAEVLYSVARMRGADVVEGVVARLDALPIGIVSAHRDLSAKAAELKAPGGLSLADCYAGALAQILQATLITGDPEFRRIADVVDIEWLPSETT